MVLSLRHPLIRPIGGTVATIRLGTSAAVIPWYLSGGIAAANCLAAYTPKGAASLAASYNNDAAPGNGLADGTYDAAPGVAPTWASATGWTFDGSTQYLKTGVDLLHPYTTIIRIVSIANPSTADYSHGILGTSPSTIFHGFRLTSAVSIRGQNGATAKDATVSGLAGVYAIAGKDWYINGADAGSDLDTSWAYNPAPTGGCFIGGRNFGGAVNGPADAVIAAFAIYNTTLTPTQVAAVSSAMALL